MNKHILLVMKWLNDSESVTQEELEANFESAYAASHAAASHADDAATDASYWIDEYFKSTGEDKQTYIDALGE
jgi:hypothetical protein